MSDKWRVWDNEKKYGEVLYKRAIGQLPEMESSKKIAKELRKYIHFNDRVLDVGCGAGHYLRSLRRELSDISFSYTGVDATSDYIELAIKAFVNDKMCTFMVSDIYDLKLEDNSHDLVMCNNVLLHLPSIEKPINELVRIAKRNVVIRLLAGERSFRIKDIAPQLDGIEFAENGEPMSYHYYNIYSYSYITYLLKKNTRVKKFTITPDFDFNKQNIIDSVDDHDKAHDASKIVGDFQVNGYVLQPWSIIEIDISN